jgi:hypothetical protein
VRVFAWPVLTLLLTMVCGCGDSTVVACFGDTAFCALAFKLIANPGIDQTVASGDVVTLDGSTSSGDIKSYSWTQTAGPAIALTNAANARATFVAPRVTNATDLTFQLTVVDRGHQADSGSTHVTVQPPAAAAVARATQLLAGPLQPQLVGVQPVGTTDGCTSATVDLPPEQTAAQIGLWLAARTIALANNVEDDPSAFLDASRALVAARAVTRDIAGQIESFGFALLDAVLEDRIDKGLGELDPALRDAIVERLGGAAMLRDPFALLMGRSEVRNAAGITLEAVDPALSMQRAVATLLASRGSCVDAAHALDLTAASLRVIGEPATRAVKE